MAEIPSPLNDMSKESVETALAFARLAMESAERLVRLQLDTARAFVDDNAAQARALAGATDPSELAHARSRAAEEVMEKAVDYSRKVYELSIQAQGELAQLMQRRVNQFNEAVLASVEQAMRTAPGADAGMAAFRSALAAATGVVGNMANMAQQARAMATEAAARAAKGAAAGKTPGRQK